MLFHLFTTQLYIFTTRYKIKQLKIEIKYQNAIMAITKKSKEGHFYTGQSVQKGQN